MGRVNLYTDGGSRGNPGPGASAFIAVVGEGPSEKVIHSEAKVIGPCTNNEAEYKALIMALEWALKKGYKEVRIHSDSQLIIRQISGNYRVKAKGLIPLYRMVSQLLDGMDWKAFQHSREEPHIQKCDGLLNKALDDAMVR